jgi:MFS family permease
MSYDPRPRLRRSLSTALINPVYARLWSGQVVSSLGDTVFTTTLILWVATVLAKGKPWAPAAVSAVLVATGAAVLLVGPVAGVFVDRWDNRRIMLRTDLARSAIAGLLAVISFVPARDLPAWAWLSMICAVVFALNAGGQFFGPARFTAIRDVVAGEADRTRAAGISQATVGIVAIVGPPLAAPLLFTFGLQWALMFNAMSYMVSFIAIRSVKFGRPPQHTPARQRSSLRAEFMAGLRFYRGSRFLVALLVLAVIGQFGVGVMEVLNVFFVTTNLHVSAHLYGYLGTAFGVGAIVGAVFAGRVAGWIGARATTWAGLIVSGALIVAYSRQTVFPAGVAVLFLAAVPVAMLNAAMAPLLMAAAPREFMGRVLAVFNPVTQLAALLSTVLAGWLASTALRTFNGSLAGLRFGPIDTILAACGLVVVVAGVYARIALPRPAPEPAAQSSHPEGALT